MIIFPSADSSTMQIASHWIQAVKRKRYLMPAISSFMAIMRISSLLTSGTGYQIFATGDLNLSFEAGPEIM